MALPFVPGQILHTDIVYLHSGQGFREAEKIKRLLQQFKYVKETSIYYSFSLNVMKISAVSILTFGENQNFTDLTGIILVFFFPVLQNLLSFVLMLLHNIYITNMKWNNDHDWLRLHAMNVFP